VGVGDKVSQSRNNYEKGTNGVFNGTQGVVAAVDLDDATLTVRTEEDEDIDYDFAELDELTHAYAVTVHRSQGSEYPCVVIPITTSSWLMLQRNLGQPAKARELFERALAIKEREYGPDHRALAPTLGNLGSAWRELGQPAKARELYVRALRILPAHVPSGHSLISIVTRNLRNVAPDLVVLNDGRVVRGAGDARPDAGFDHSTGRSIT
jgi:tetratricopeptide (TPR) repeat protein